MNTREIFLTPLSALLLMGYVSFTAGCASSREQAAVAELHQVQHALIKVEPTRRLMELTETSELSDYLTYAALNNPQLEAAFNQWKAALKRIPQARSLPDPRFTYAYFIENVETRVGPQEQRFGLSQMFPWFGKLQLRGEVALEEANAMRQQYEVTKLKLFYQVKDAYYEFYYLGRAIAISEENVRLMQHIESVARAKHKAGAPLSGVVKAQVELGKLDDQLRTLQDLKGPVMARLNAVMNRSAEASLPWPEKVPVLGKVTMSDQDVLRWLSENNPELKSLSYQIKKSEKVVALARKEYFPDITLGVDYVQTGEARMPGVADSGKDPIMAMVSINLPIWGEKLRSRAEEAKAKRDSSEEIRTNRENALRAELKMALYRCRDAERKINLYGGTLIPQAEQSLNVAQQAYEAGKVDFLDLIDAQRLLLQFQLEYERARANYHQRFAEIEMLVGQPVPTAPVKPPALPAPIPKENQP